MKKLMLFLTFLSVPFVSVFAERYCRNGEQIAYQASELARESRQLAQTGWGRNGRFGGRYGNRFADEARRLAHASRQMAQSARYGADCRDLFRMFYQSVEPAFRNLMEEARGPVNPEYNDDLRDIRRAFQDLRRELFEDDHGRNPRPRPPGRDR